MEQRQVSSEMKSDLSPEGFLKNPARRAIVERWRKWIPTHDGRGAPVKMDAHKQWCLAQLYENQLTELKGFKEKHMIGEETTTVNSAPFIKYTFPLLRRVWPSLIAPEIVSVQPMTAPIGAVFYFELKYGTTKGSTVAGDKVVRNFNRTFSSTYVDAEVMGSGDGSLTAFTNARTAFLPVIPGTFKLGATAGGAPVVVADDGQGKLVGPAVAAGSTINYTSGAVSLTFTTAPDNDSNLVAAYSYGGECSASIPEIDIDIAMIAVTAKSRKLKALWCSEAADDLKALHGVDAEQELVAGLGSELALEIDREIIEDIRLGYTGASATYSLAPQAGVRELDQIRGLLTPITLIANQIGKNTLRGPANWMVMSYDLAAYIEQLSTDDFFRPIFAGNAGVFDNVEAPQTWGMMKMGTVQTRYVAYKDPYLTPNELLMGFKGNSFVDAGYVFAPYVPLQITSTFLDPNDFRFRKGMRTRYAKVLARSEFFGKLTVQGLTTLSPGAFGPGQTQF